MSRCRQCNIEVLDETNRCPLCGTVLEPTIEMENMYPDIRVKSRKLVFISRLYLFLAIVVEILLVNICMLSEVQSIVYIICGLVLLFGYIVIRYAILGTSGYLAKTVVLTVIAVIMLVAIDFSVGYNGWSVNYALPAGILLIDVGTVAAMAINSKNWQSYLMLQIFMVLCSVVAIVLNLVHIVTDPIVSIMALNVSAVLLLGTVIIGGRRARVELKRRFHI
ncbi:MAG: zinc ribbon domain-containing protein [Lachnospiraceae bacterium]|nr:zinc ribbon domain-containing protein [Lachnospiraceae bacterium]MDE7028633.1 zinc ribbon domain-containing protein [Lachnospiraceae bacterium]